MALNPLNSSNVEQLVLKGLTTLGLIMYILFHKECSVSHNAVVTCEIKLFRNHFRGIIAAHEYFPTCSMSLKHF